MRKVALILAGMAVLTQALPAQAAVPKRTPDRTMTCSSSKHQVKIWDSRGRSAVNNGCKAEWVVIASNGWESGESSIGVLNVAPGAHFNWSQKELVLHDTEVRWTKVRLAPEPACNEDEGSSVILRGSHGRTSPLKDC